MPTVNDLLDQIAFAIQQRPVSVSARYTVCWHEGRFKCLPYRTVPRDAGNFGTYSDDDLRQGLTVIQWNFLARKVALFFEQVKT